jgi:hypothetical protein
MKDLSYREYLLGNFQNHKILDQLLKHREIQVFVIISWEYRPLIQSSILEKLQITLECLNV